MSPLKLLQRKYKKKVPLLLVPFFDMGDQLINIFQ